MRPLKEGKEYNPINKYSQVNKLITEILCNRGNFCYCDIPGYK